MESLGSIRVPFVGPRPFTHADRDLFFGRGSELPEIISGVIANPFTLLFARSGAGKSSLLAAGLAPALEEQGFQVLPLARFGPAPLSGTADWDGILSCSGIDSLARLQDSLEHIRAAEKQGIVLILDQFEELLKYRVDSSESLRSAINTLTETTQHLPSTRIVIALREDFLGALLPLERLFPDRLRNRFRIAPLTMAQAEEAVGGPLSVAGVAFADAAGPRELVRDLSQSSAMEGPEEGSGWVEPLLLQVVCLDLWQRAVEGGKGCLALEDGIQGSSVDDALAGYFDRVVDNLGPDGRRVRIFVEERLLTEHAKRKVVAEGTVGVESDGMEILAKLVKAHVVRQYEVRGAKWWEISHERLAAPLVLSNTRWKAELEGSEKLWTSLEGRAGKWAIARDETLLLNPSELNEARAVLEMASVRLKEFVKLSDERIEKERTRFRVAIGMLTLGLLLAVVVSLEMYSLTRQAEGGQERAEEAQFRADSARRVAEDQFARAIALRGLASAPGASDVYQQAQLFVEAANRLRGTADSTILPAALRTVLSQVPSGRPLAGAWSTAPVDGLALRDSTVLTVQGGQLRSSDGEWKPPVPADDAEREYFAVAEDGLAAAARLSRPGRSADSLEVVWLPAGGDPSPRRLALAGGTGGFVEGAGLFWSSAADANTTVLSIEAEPIHRIIVGPTRFMVASNGGATLTSAGLSGPISQYRWGSGPELPNIGTYEWPIRYAAVTAMAGSPVEDVVALGASDGSLVLLWDSAFSRLYPRQSGEVSSLAFSRDGRTLYSGSVDGRIRRWDVENRMPLPDVGSHLGRVRGLRVVDSVGTIATWSDDGTARLWSSSVGHADTLRVSYGGRRPEKGHLTHLRFNPIDGAPVIATEDNNVRVYHRSSERFDYVIESTLADETATQYALDVNAAGEIIYSDARGRVFYWRTGGDSVRLIANLEGTAVGAAFAGGRAVAVAGSGGVIQVIPLPNGDDPGGEADPVMSHRHAVAIRQLDASSDGTVVVGDGAGRLLAWVIGDSLAADSLEVFSLGSGDGVTVTALSLSHSARYIAATLNWDANIQIVAIDVEQSPDSSEATRVSGLRRLRVLRTGEAPDSLIALRFLRWPGAPAELEPLLLSLSMVNRQYWTVRLWDASTGQLLETLFNSAQPLSAIDFAPPVIGDRRSVGIATPVQRGGGEPLVVLVECRLCGGVSAALQDLRSRLTEWLVPLH